MAEPIKRLHYFDHQFLREKDFADEQEYHLGMRRHHNRLLHTWGIAEGLQVPDPPEGATAVTVETGTAIDSQGREIVLTEDKSVELEQFTSSEAVYVTIAYHEEESDRTDETGGEGNRRWTEEPLVEASETAPTPTEHGLKLVLARVERSGTVVASVDPSERRAAGVVGGDLEVRGITLSHPEVISEQWPHIGAAGPTAPNRADLEGGLHVSGDLDVEGTILGDLAVGSVGTSELANNAVSTAKIANNAVNADKIQDGSVGTAELANNAVSTAKIASNAVNADKIQDGSVGSAELANNAVGAAKLDAATRGKLVTNGDSHDHSGGDGATIRHSTVKKDDGTNPHGTTAANVGALPTTGGTIAGSIDAHRSYTPPPPRTIHLYPVYALRAQVNRDPAPPAPPAPIPFNVKAAAMGISKAEGVYGVYAEAVSGTPALYVAGTAKFTGAKTGYVVDTFINASGQVLRTGDIVKLTGAPITRYQGDDNKVPVAAVTTANKESDSAVIGIVDREAIPNPGEPDTRTTPEDPTSIPDGEELFVVTLGAYAHCKADATEAPIEVGDLLTTSSNPGHARKATDPKIGTIIGKALEPLKEGTGYVAVFVNIQ